MADEDGGLEALRTDDKLGGDIKAALRQEECVFEAGDAMSKVESILTNYGASFHVVRLRKIFILSERSTLW